MNTSLPPSVRQVLQLAATGLSSREIADRVGVPAEDVRRHLVEALNLLGARSKLEAVIKAARQDMIDLPLSAEGVHGAIAPGRTSRPRTSDPA